MKRIIEKTFTLILAAFIMLVAMSTNVFATGGSQLSSKTTDDSKDGGKLAVTIESVSVGSGEYVEMAVSISDAPGLNLIIFENIAYDANLLKLISATWEEKGENDFDYNESELPEDKDLMMREFGDKDVDINGRIATLKFEVIGKNGDSAEVSFNVAMISVDSTSALEYDLKKGIVTIVCSHVVSEDWQNDDENHWRICKKCNAKVDEVTHVFDNIKETKAATCTEKGEKTTICSVCNYAKTEEIPALGHSYADEWSYDKDSHWHDCKNGCGEKNGTASHTYNWTVEKEATEDEEGLERGICTVCNYETTRAIPKKDHEHKYSTEWIKDEANHWHECKCGDKTDIAVHTYNWAVETEATEEDEGLERGTCTVCKYETTRAIPKNDHEHKYSEVWFKDEANHWHECKCGDKTGVAAHTYNWTVETEATEEAEGLERGICSVCKYETTRAIPKKDHEHKYGEEWAKDKDNHWHECKCGEKTGVAEHSLKEVIDTEPTEESDGVAHDECEVCGFVTNEGKVIPALEHTHITEKVEAKPATCTEEGNIEYYTCIKCRKNFSDEDGEFEIENVVTKKNPANHIGETRVDGKLEPDCSNVGYTGDTVCVSCGVILIKGEVIPTNDNHNYEWKIDVEPTFEEIGLKHEECTRCGAKRNENTEIPRIECAHSAMQHFDAVRSTCVIQGTREYWYCFECNRKYFDEKGMLSVNGDDELLAPIDPENHIKTELRNVKSATCTTEGFSGDKYCSDCDKLIENGSTIPVDSNAHKYVGNRCEYCDHIRSTYYDYAIIYVNDENHLSGGVLARHIPDSMTMHTDGVYEWRYCAYCHHEYDKVAVVDINVGDSVDLIVDDPVQSGDDEPIPDVPATEPEPAEPVEDNNPPTGVAIAVLPMVLAAAAAIASKKMNK